MTELATREFISQWTYDHGQDRDDVRDEAAVQCIGVDRVAELMRQRHEHHLDGNFNAMDFDTRAATIDAHFLRAPRCESPGSDRKPQTPLRPTRVRPQSASLARRAVDSSTAQRGISVRQRPQSAKYRSDMALCDESVGQVDWNTSAQEKTSKWREMLARGPEFQQLTLRKLELETYELLYKTLDQRQEINAKPTRRRRKRENAESTCKPNSSSPAPACGSGLHLARSRKKRQQEHDRQMMLGKDRQNSRRSDKEKAKGEDKQMIQEKTRRRNKLLSKKKSQRGCRRDDQVAKQEKQTEEPRLQRPSSAHRTKRGPWIPSGSSSSLAIRGISSEASGLPVTQEERIAQVFEVFQSHAKAHFRFSKHVQKQLKKAQQCAKTAIANESRKTKQAVKHFSESEYPAKHGRPASASRVIEHTSNYVYRGNQEDDQVEVVHGATPSALLSKSKPPANEDESLPGGSSATLRLVIPPLKLPPNLWEYQLTGSTLDEDCQLYQEESNVTLKDINTIAPPVVSKDEASFSQPKSEKPQADSSMRDKPATPVQALRRPTVEDVYLAESDVEQGSARLSTDGSKSSLVPLDEELQPLLTREKGAPTDIGAYTPTFLPDNTLPIGVGNAQSSSNSNELLLVDTSLGLANREDSQTAARLTAIEQKAFIDTTTNKPASYQSSTHTFVNSIDARGYERNVSVENTASESTNSGIDLVEKHNAAAIYDCAVDTISHSIITGNMELTGDSASDEHKGSGDISDDILVHEADVNSPMSLIAGVKDAKSSNFTSDLLLDNHSSIDHRFNKALSEKQYDPTMIKNTGVPRSPDPRPGSLDQLSSPASTLRTSDSDSVNIERTSEIVQTTIFETSNILDRCDRGSGAFQSESNQWHVSQSGCGERQEAQDDTTILSSPPSRECPIMEIPNVVVAAQSATISSPPNEVDEILPALGVKDDRFVVEGSRSAKRASRSPKRRAKKPKDPLSVKSVSLRKSRPVANPEQCSSSQPAAVDASTFVVLKSRTSSPEDHGRRGEEEEDHLRLHQQDVTRAFLKRISSRKVVEPETGSIQSQPSKEQVGGDDEVGTAESVAAKAVLTATNIEDQVEPNVIPVKDEYNDGDTDSTLDPVRPSDSESTVEKHPLAKVSVRSPATTTDVATTPSTERVGMTPGFTSGLDEDFTPSSATVASYAQALQSSVVEAPNLGKERRMPITEDAQPELEISTVVADTNQPQSPRRLAPEHYHHAARKIQAQYRCFARRRIILDQLRFIVAKQRREARRQSRVKTKRTKEVVVDTFASVPTGEYESHIMAVAVSDVSRFGGGLSEDIHQVAVEMSSAAPLIQLGEDVKFAARKDSSDYVFDLFDGSNQANGEEMQEAATGIIAEAADNAVGESATSSENLVDQQDLYAVSEKDVDTVNIANATTSREPLQREEGFFYEQPLRPTSLGLGVETQQPAGVGLISSTLLAELAFDDVEDVQSAALCGLQPHWERYMDSATNKSFYFNPATNETQWTNPEDHTVINSIGTPTTSHGATVTATDVKVNNASTSAQVWQEFLDETRGQLYYYNTQTGECSWEAPAADSDAAEVVASPQSGATAETAALGASPWIMYIDPASQAPYYVNVETLATTWEQPEKFAVAAPESTAVVTADAGSVIEDAYVIAVDD